MGIMKKTWILSLMILGGCSTIGNLPVKLGYEKLSAVNVQIAQASAKYSADMTNLQRQIENQNERVLSLLNSNQQNAANQLYGANVAYASIVNPSRADLLINYKVNTAQKYLPAPSLDAILQQNEEVKKELNAALVSNAQLQQKYEVLARGASVAQSSLEAAKNDVNNLQREKSQIIKDDTDAINALQNKSSEISGQLLNQSQKIIENLRNNQALKGKLVFIFMGAGIILGALGFYIKSINLGVVGIASIFTGLLIMYIKPWQVIAAALVLVGCAIAELIRKHDLEKKTATNLVGATNEITSLSIPVEPAKAQSIVSDWNTKYAKDSSGNLIKIPDAQVQANINSKLASLQAK